MSKAVSNVPKIITLTAVLAAGAAWSATPASADHRPGHHVRGHHLHGPEARGRAVGPAPGQVAAEGDILSDNPRRPYVDDGSRYDTEFDGVAIGREGDLVPRDGSGPRFARSGASFEIEGAPISPSLPVVPELVDPSLY